MRKTILFICISLMTLGLWGCSVVPVQQEPVKESDITTESINEVNNSANQNNQDGDELEGGSFYFDEVVINSYNDAVTFLKKYSLYKEGESYSIYFETPKYYGWIIYVLEEDHFIISKNGENFCQEYTHSRDGIVDSNCWETNGDDVGETTEPVILGHGVKIDDTTVYIDTSVVDIKGEQSIGDFFDLIDEHFGAFNEENWYTFVTDDSEYTVRGTSYGYAVGVTPAEKLDQYTTEEIRYNNDESFKEHVKSIYEHGECVETSWRGNNYLIKKEYSSNGAITNTETKNGKTVIKKYITIDDTTYVLYYKNDRKEHVFTYDESGTRLVGFKATDLKYNEVYDWVLDGNGLEPDNCVSVTVTKNGSSKTYVGKSQIPWGSPIYYPPKSIGSYE